MELEDLTGYRIAELISELSCAMLQRHKVPKKSGICLVLQIPSDYTQFLTDYFVLY
jgi:hypothetical protein